MKLSKSAEYALIVMSYLACHSEKGPLRARDIAANVEVPAAYISKILRKMVQANLLTGERGHGGGFILARPAAEISFLKIFEGVDGEIDPSRCVFGWGKCSERNPCILHFRWKEAKGLFLDWANSCNLAMVQRDIRKNKIVIPQFKWAP